MREVCVDIYENKAEVAEYEKTIYNLYNWLSDSPTGTDDDLAALDFCITVLGKMVIHMEYSEI